MFVSFVLPCTEYQRWLTKQLVMTQKGWSLSQDTRHLRKNNYTRESLTMLFSDWVTQKMLQETAEPGMVAHVCNSCIWDQKQKDCKFKTSLGYILRV